MARPPRQIEPGTTYHLISRFVDREWFIRSSAERELYLKLLGLALKDSDWRLMGYGIMSNHIHLTSIAGEQPLGDWVRRVHSPFADSMNRAHNRIGVMFVRGPKAYPVRSDSFPHVLAYIHNNPVRAGVCATAAESSWTSHRAYIGRASVPGWLHVCEGLVRAGFHDPVRFDDWVNDPARADTDMMFTEDHYERDVELLRQAKLASLSRTSQSTAEAIVTATAEVLGITVERIRSTTRGRAEVLGRSLAVHCATAAGVSGRAIASALHLSQQRVSALRQQQFTDDVRSLYARVTRHVAGSGSSSD